MPRQAMRLELDGKGATYQQIVRALRQAIRSGRLPRGTKLASSREFAMQLGVSRGTVTTAYDRLLSDGWLTARVGAGTFVAGPTLRQRRAGPAPPSEARLSRFARRLLDEVVVEDLPGKVIPGVRHMFQYKAPYTDHTLLGAWTRALKRAADYSALRYARCHGIEPLRVQVGDFLARRRGMVVDPDDIIIVNGSQQAFSLCARLLLEPGEKVLVEEPNYYPMRVVFQAYGARLLLGNVDRDGITLDRLEQAPRIVAVTPAHQFPLGYPLSTARRKALLDYAAANGAWIVEDDYDGEYRYDGRPTRTLQSMDHQGRVIYAGSFSKTFFPAIRLGYVVVPPALRDAFITAKFLEDMGAPVVIQAAMAFLLEDGAFDRHLARSVRELRVRRDALVTGLRNHFPDLRISGAGAGMHLVVTRPGWTPEQVEELKARALQRGLAIYSTIPYYAGAATTPGLLLGYASMSVAEIGRGLRLLKEALDSLEGGHPTMPGRAR